MKGLFGQRIKGTDEVCVRKGLINRALMEERKNKILVYLKDRKNLKGKYFLKKKYEYIIIGIAIMY